MNFKSLLFFAVSIVFVPIISLAQAPKSFSSDASKYLSELQLFMEATNKKEGAEIIAAFTPVWSKFSAEMQQTIIATSNGMLQKRMKAFPDFKEYILALTAFSNSNQTAGNFTGWHKSLEKMLEGKTRSYTNYVSSMGGLFKDNTLYSSASTQWMVSAPSYTLDYDTLPKVNFTKIDLSSKARGDSITIYNTSGSFYPTIDMFYGNGGRVTWERAGTKPTDMFADLFSYSINVTKGEYVADSAMFQIKNSEYMNRPISGKVTDKIIAGSNSETINYPKFDSHEERSNWLSVLYYKRQ
jgi:hypothetical protein